LRFATPGVIPSPSQDYLIGSFLIFFFYLLMFTTVKCDGCRGTHFFLRPNPLFSSPLPKIWDPFFFSSREPPLAPLSPPIELVSVFLLCCRPNLSQVFHAFLNFCFRARHRRVQQTFFPPRCGNFLGCGFFVLFWRRCHG